ncbi:ribonuclease P protein subunit p40-like isoform X2 [Dreissena polymorpha]|uniref:ribonuclease P protein subunit p40-like isoform X2 n=1 Tax=Dreissena polymorpha TaxID=45954 RepID=UPI002264FB34|nr:ribonuclease P protein subunit p40-like isoform X2 [Dreissena polymorpha]
MAASMNDVLNTGKLVFERSSFKNEKENHKMTILNQYFNHTVQLLLPGTEDLPADMDTLLIQEASFLVREVPLSFFLNEEFIEGFVKSGLMQALSVGTCVDNENCIALLPTGVLLLSVCTDTYQDIGLEGRPSEWPNKHVIEIDLTDKNFRSGNKLHARTKSCFNERWTLKWDFLVNWTPKDPKICSTSIQNYFKHQNIVCNRLKFTKHVQKHKQLMVPTFCPDSFECSGKQIMQSGDCGERPCDQYEVFEWLGACALGVEMTGNGVGDYISNYTCPSPNTTVPAAVCASYSSMFSSHTIQLLMEKLRDFMQTKDQRWCSVTVHGFMDAPVAWRRDHGFHSNGDNLYTFVLFQNGDYWQIRALGPQDNCV